ncbi:WD40 repeat domain-containing protein [Paenibacillus aurantiacus]|uniref:WD40 repeat domain-containing protein n=2 Tax=Paenibacillus aurantiacus TaxID=1936118 RepID=A0ABV5KH39_9BACL
MFAKLPHVSQVPIAVHYTPDSILQFSEPPMPHLTVVDRQRYGTCTDVKWLHQSHTLATLNMATETIHTYVFDSHSHTLSPIQTLGNEQGMELHWPEKFAFANNGKYMAVANSKIGKCAIQLYRMEPTGWIHPGPVQTIEHEGSVFHDVQFSPDSRFMVSTTMDAGGHIRFYSLEEGPGGELNITLTQTTQSLYLPLKPKAIAFSGDGALIAICFGPNAGTLNPQSFGVMAIHTFDGVTGTMSEQPVHELYGRPELSVPDSVTFSHDAGSSMLIIPSQSNDTIVFYAFDKSTCQIDPNFFSFTNPNAQLSFPHGVSLSADDRYLAVSNYGDDKITIYAL